MKRLTFVVAVVGSALASVACASRQPEIELTSSDFDLNPLVGEWRGNYSSAETRRNGTIAFTLRAAESAASGNVVMLPRADSSFEANHAPVDPSIPNTREVLTIHFVRKEGSNVVGTLDPYLDPECACQVATTFQGAFRDRSTIEGIYTTVPSISGRKVTSGKWRVTRVKKL
ncbi:MAG: hypothetical protein QOK07_729 [Gemmatimonadaceae bacterium]|jgi:hypothetical protein|nr:hypothetical protein [Gemmatimonadaceae bacterium]